MEQSYEVRLDGKGVGEVKLERQGLYIRVLCRCSLPEGEVHRLIAVCADCREPIGILIPRDGKFVLERKIPAKRLTEANLSFCLEGKNPPDTGKFVPIYPEEPFAYLEKLEHAFLANQAGQLGIVIADSPRTESQEKSSSSPTGQWSEPSTSL